MRAVLLTVFTSLFCRAALAGADFLSVTENPPNYTVWLPNMLGSEAKQKNISVWLAKEEFDSLDRTGSAYLLIRGGDFFKSMGKPALTFTLKRKGSPDTLRTQSVTLNPGGAEPVRGFDADINMTEIPVSGEGFDLDVTVTDGGAEKARASAFFRKTETAAPKTSGEIALTVKNPLPESKETVQEPVHLAVPLPKGALKNDSMTAVFDAAGNEIPCQTAVLSRWDKNGSVRALGVSFIAGHKPGRAESVFTLKYGPGVVRKPVQYPLTVAETADMIEINTGVIKALLPKKNGKIIEKVYYDLNGDGKYDETELAAVTGPKDGPALTREGGGEYFASLDSAPLVTIEERGPLRAVIRVESWYKTAPKDGQQDKLCKHITRLLAYRGMPRLDLSHGWLMTARSFDARFSDISFSLTVPEASNLFLAGDADRPLFSDITGAGSVRYLLQDSWCHYRVGMNILRKEIADPERKTRERFRTQTEGFHSAGWGSAQSKRSGVLIGCEDFWQNYPKEISVEGGRLSFHVWPKHGSNSPAEVKEDGDLNKLLWLHKAGTLDFRVPPEILTHTGGETWHTSKYFLFFGAGADAMGLMKTHEIRILFHPAAKSLDDGLSARASALLKPCLAFADPKFAAASGVFGPLSVRDPAKYPAEERLLHDALRIEQNMEAADRDYGMFIFGDGHDGYDFTERRFNTYRAWRNMHHGCGRAPWLLFFRSGDTFFLERGLRSARRAMDIGLCHYTVPEMDGTEYQRNKTVGGLCDYKGLVPWSAGARVGDYNSTTDFMIWQSWQTGLKRGMEVAEEWWTGVRRWVSPGGSARSQAGTLSAAVDLYNATLDSRMLPFIHAEFEGLLTGQNQEFGYFDEWQNYAPWIEAYWLLTKSRRAADVMIKWADACVNFDYGNIHYGEASSCAVPAFASMLTNDPKYLGFIKRKLRTFTMSSCDDALSNYYRMCGASHVSLYGYLLQTLPFALEAGNRFRGEPPPPSEGRFLIRPPVPAAPEKTIEWKMLLENDSPVEIVLCPRTSLQELHFKAAASDGRTLADEKFKVTQALPHGTSVDRPEKRIIIEPKGARGVCSLSLSAKEYFSLSVPASAAAREIYPAETADGGASKISLEEGPAFFSLPKGGGPHTARATIIKTDAPFPCHILDGNENILSAAWRTASGTLARINGEPAVLDPSKGEVFAVQSGIYRAHFTVEGASPPKYYAASKKRLFNPDDYKGASK